MLVILREQSIEKECVESYDVFAHPTVKKMKFPTHFRQRIGQSFEILWPIY